MKNAEAHAEKYCAFNEFWEMYVCAEKDTGQKVSSNLNNGHGTAAFMSVI